MIKIILDGALLASCVSTVGDGAELRHGYAIDNFLCARGDLLAALGAKYADHAPKAPSGERHLGEACARLNGIELLARRAACDTANPSAVRWIVGSPNADREGSSLGARDLLVDLCEDGSLSFVVLTSEGNPLTAIVQAAYAKRVSGETYNTTTMLSWLRSVLVARYCAVTSCDTIYVPAARVAAAREFVACVAPLMGRATILRTVPSDAGLREGLLIGFVARVEGIERDLDGGKIGTLAILNRLYECQTIVKAYTDLLGEAHTATVTERIAALHAAAAARLASEEGSERTANLEM